MNFEQLLEACQPNNVSFTPGNDILKAAQERRQDQMRERAIEATTNIMGSGDKLKQSFVEDVRRLRNRLRDRLQNIKTIELAEAYFHETGNPIPYLMETGQAHRVDNYIQDVFGSNVDIPEEARTVPKGWEPSES